MTDAVKENVTNVENYDTNVASITTPVNDTGEIGTDEVIEFKGQEKSDRQEISEGLETLEENKVRFLMGSCFYNWQRGKIRKSKLHMVYCVVK